MNGCGGHEGQDMDKRYRRPVDDSCADSIHQALALGGSTRGAATTWNGGRGFLEVVTGSVLYGPFRLQDVLPGCNKIRWGTADMACVGTAESEILHLVSRTRAHMDW